MVPFTLIFPYLTDLLFLCPFVECDSTVQGDRDVTSIQVSLVTTQALIYLVYHIPRKV